MLTLGQAAKLCGRTKTTISKAIEKRRLSATKNDLGQYQIDPAELGRVYPYTVNNNTEVNATGLDKTAELTAENSSLKGQLEVMRELLEQVKGERDRAREDSAEWRKTIYALLPPPQKAEEALKAVVEVAEAVEPSQTPASQPSGFWRRMFG